jgi:hypothetical protein
MLLKPFIALLCFITGITAQAQTVLATSWTDKANAPAEEKKATYLQVYYKHNDTAFIHYTYQKKDYCTQFTTYADSSFKNKHGWAATYTNPGWVEECGQYLHNKRHGLWLRRIGPFNYVKENYQHGLLLSSTEKIYILAPSEPARLNGSKEELGFPGGAAALKKYMKERINELVADKKIGDTDAVIAYTINERGYVALAFPWRSQDYATDFALKKMIEQQPIWQTHKKSFTTITDYYLQPVKVFTDK